MWEWGENSLEFRFGLLYRQNNREGQTENIVIFRHDCQTDKITYGCHPSNTITRVEVRISDTHYQGVSGYKT